MRAAIAILALLTCAGCAASPPPRANDLAPAPAGVDDRLAAADRDPLSAPALVEAARALAAAGRAGEAHPLLLAAGFLAANPPAGRPAFPESYARAIEREAEAAQRRTLPPAGPEEEEAAPAPAQPRRREESERTGGFAGGREPVVRPVPRPPRAPTPGRRAREEALRLYAAREFAGVLARLAETPGAVAGDPRLSRVVASCDLELALGAARAGEDARAVELLFAAANADPIARVKPIYADVARLERRRAMIAATRPGGEDEAAKALLRAFRAAPEEPESLYLLSRGKGEVAAYARATLLASRPKSPEARAFAVADRIRAARDTREATAAVEGFEAENPRASGVAADLWSLVADRGSGEAAREATEALARYDAAREAASRSRDALFPPAPPDSR